MRKATKIIISFAVVLIAGLNFVIPAFAQDPFSAIAIGGIGGASGAGLFGSMAGMSGIDIAWSSTGSDPMDAMWNVLNPDHVYFSGEKHEADPQTYPEDIYDYIQVDIGDWLQAQSDFIQEFVRENNVTDNSSGTITGSRNYQGVPLVYENYNWFTGSIGTFTQNGFYSCGDLAMVVSGSDPVFTVTTYKAGQLVTTSQLHRDYLGREIRICFWNGGSDYYLFVPGTSSFVVGPSAGANLSQTTAPENVSWTSGTVDTSVFDGWESAKVKIPRNLSGLSAGWTVPDFMNALDLIWYGHGEDNIIIENGGDVPPVPPVPIPDTPLGNVPFDDWVDLWGQGIYQQLENQSDALDFIGSNGTDAIEELESIDENIGALEEAAESIDTNIGIGNGILGGIRSLAQEAVDYLEGIAEHVGELVEEIVAGTETLIAGILNQIPQAFGVIFSPIKQASSIWHYVVEWITSIGAPFQFIWSMASGTSYYIILPVYASLAAAVVLAFFKRFGR